MDEREDTDNAIIFISWLLLAVSFFLLSYSCLLYYGAYVADTSILPPRDEKYKYQTCDKHRVVVQKIYRAQIRRLYVDKILGIVWRVNGNLFCSAGGHPTHWLHKRSQQIDEILIESACLASLFRVVPRK